ncbi:hypothetical protein [Bombilactobacillus folatiphilus]|nr:hypothetical protein [Bombilactobacillus folatiphilus]
MERQKQVQILRDLIAINSVGGNELEVAQYLQMSAKKILSI